MDWDLISSAGAVSQVAHTSFSVAVTRSQGLSPCLDREKSLIHFERECQEIEMARLDEYRSAVFALAVVTDFWKMS